MQKNEANLVFAIGVQLMFRDVPFEIEWSSKVGRHDIAIKDDHKLYGIIEVKHIEVYRTPQIQRYESI